MISYVVVDERDPAFKNPTKPIGPVFTEEQAKRLPYTTQKTPKGYRGDRRGRHSRRCITFVRPASLIPNAGLLPQPNSV